MEVTTSEVLVVVQAVAAAVSAATAVYLVRVTLARDRDARAERDRERAHEQLRGLVDGLNAVREAFSSRSGDDFLVAQARLATALALWPNILPSCEAVIADDMPKPPYRLGATTPFERLAAALSEVRSIAWAMSQGPASGPGRWARLRRAFSR